MVFYAWIIYATNTIINANTLSPIFFPGRGRAVLVTQVITDHYSVEIQESTNWFLRE